MGWERRDRTVSGEAGSALPLALAFVTVMGLIVTSLLTLAAANLRAGVALRDHRDRSLAADVGLEWAFSQAPQLVAAASPTAVSCPTTLVVNGATVVVSCSGPPSSFEVRSVASKGDATVTAVATISASTVGYTSSSWRTVAD